MNELTKKILEVLEIEPDMEITVEYNNCGEIDKFTARYNSTKQHFEFYDDYKEWSNWYIDLSELCTQKIKIIKKSWKPKCNEKYYFIEDNGYINFFNNDNCYLDLMCWHTGNCFKTKEEAEDNKDRIMKLYESDIPLWKKIEDKQ